MWRHGSGKLIIEIDITSLDAPYPQTEHQDFKHGYVLEVDKEEKWTMSLVGRYGMQKVNHGIDCWNNQLTNSPVYY
jgi:hypothetical protein